MTIDDLRFRAKVGTTTTPATPDSASRATRQGTSTPGSLQRGRGRISSSLETFSTPLSSRRGGHRVTGSLLAFPPTLPELEENVATSTRRVSRNGSLSRVMPQRQPEPQVHLLPLSASNGQSQRADEMEAQIKTSLAAFNERLCALEASYLSEEQYNQLRGELEELRRRHQAGVVLWPVGNSSGKSCKLSILN